MKNYKNFIYEQFDEPDLRKIGMVVKCIKDYPEPYTSDFKSGEKYIVSGLFGDPQRAIEEFNINDYLPIECMSAIEIRSAGEYTGIKKELFKVNGDIYPVYNNRPDFFEYFEIPGKAPRKKNKISKPEIDPFGEENWWETNEQVKMKFDVGDRVEAIEGRLTPNRMWHKVGTIMRVTGDGRYLVQFDEYVNGHDGSGSGTSFKEGNCWHFEKDEIKYSGKKRIKKLNLEDDPFGEDDWGYIQENKTNGLLVEKITHASDTLIGVYYDFGKNVNKIEAYLNKKLVGKKVTFKWEGQILCEVIDRVKFEDYFYFYCNGVEYRGIDLDFPIDVLKGGEKSLRRRLNLEDDPFGEEDWGYIQEKISIYDIEPNQNCEFVDIECNSKLEYDELLKILEDHGYKWGLTGNNPTELNYWEPSSSIKYISLEIDNGERKIYNQRSNRDKEPIKFSEMENKKRIKKLNLEDDPFGEENWGYANEGLFKYDNEEEVIKTIKKYSDKLNKNVDLSDLRNSRVFWQTLDWSIHWYIKNVFVFACKYNRDDANRDGKYEFVLHNDKFFNLKGTKYKKHFKTIKELLNLLDRCGLNYDELKEKEFDKEQEIYLNLENDPFGEEIWVK